MVRFHVIALLTSRSVSIPICHWYRAFFFTKVNIHSGNVPSVLLLRTLLTPCVYCFSPERKRGDLPRSTHVQPNDDTGQPGRGQQIARHRSTTARPLVHRSPTARPLVHRSTARPPLGAGLVAAQGLGLADRGLSARIWSGRGPSARSCLDAVTSLSWHEQFLAPSVHGPEVPNLDTKTSAECPEVRSGGWPILPVPNFGQRRSGGVSITLSPPRWSTEGRDRHV